MRIDLGAAVTFADAKAAARDFLHWWEGELLACVPERWQQWYHALFRTPGLLLNADEWQLTGFDSDENTLSFDPKAPAYESRELRHASRIPRSPTAFWHSFQETTFCSGA